MMQNEKESLVTGIYSMGKENKKYTIYNLPPTSSSHRDMGMSRLKYSCLRCQLGDQMLSFDHNSTDQKVRPAAFICLLAGRLACVCVCVCVFARVCTHLAACYMGL